MAYRRRGGPKGRKCIRRKRVRVRGQGMALRCVKYGAKRSGGGSRSRRRKGYRRGHRPFNKGRKCIEKGLNRRGRVVCRDFGGKRLKNRRRSRPLYASPQLLHNYMGKRRERRERLLDVLHERKRSRAAAARASAATTIIPGTYVDRLMAL